MLRRLRSIFQRDSAPASNRIQLIGYWATILGFFISSYFAWKSYDLSIKQAKNEDSINALKNIAQNQITQNQRLEDLITKNRIQTDTLVGVIRRLDSQNKNLVSILSLNTKQVKIIEQQLSLSEQSSNTFEQENLRKFEESSSKLTDLFPSQDFNNFFGQYQRYEEIRKELRQVLKNPFTFGYGRFIFRCNRLESDANIMKIHFYNRSVGEQGGICYNNYLLGFEYDKCAYEHFSKDYVDFLNYMQGLISLKRYENYEKNLKIKDKKFFQIIKEEMKRLQKDLK
jgi:hypothetical protein